MWIIKAIFIQTFLFVLNVIGQEPTNEVIFRNSTYGVFTADNVSDSTWLSAQDSCASWSGNLATITSQQEDTLLYYLPDMDTYYSCWIGLNDRDNEAGADGSAFVWVDGSNSTYRQFSTTPFSQPNDTDGTKDCVGFRYQNGTEISDGWNNRDCNETSQCYFCQKSGDSRGCDLIYEGSCYRAFEVSDGINWLDAQSSCAVWGGDLTSITTERENNLLYTITNGPENGTWIGLYDREGDGNLKWTNGATLNYTNWAANVNISNNTRDCIELLTDATWNNTFCDDKKRHFICQKQSSNTTIIERFGQLIDGGLSFNPLSGNNFVFESTMLVCRGDENSNPIEWLFSYSPNLSPNQTLTATYMNTETGISWLSIDMNQKGYYMCKIDDTTEYIIGLYDGDNVKVLAEGEEYTYVVGVDREEIIFLCENTDPEYELTAFFIKVKDLVSFQNPIKLYDWRSYFPEERTEIYCMRNLEIMSTTYLATKDPLMSLYNGSVHNFTSLSPTMHNATVDFLTENVFLSINVFGKWILPDNTNYTHSQINYQVFTPMLCGIYHFVIIDIDGVEKMVMKIQIEAQAVGSYFASLSPSLEYTLHDTNEIFFADTKFVCFTTDYTYPIQWKYQATQLSDITDITSLSVWNATYGTSMLSVSTDQSGYYSCDLTIPAVNRTTYTVGVFDSTSTFEAMNNTMYTFLTGVDASNVQLLCTSNNTPLSLSNISWIVNGEFMNNPLTIASLPNANNTNITCIGNSSELLASTLTVLGPPLVTISCNWTVQMYDLIIPETNIATISAFTENVRIASNLPSGHWVTPRSTIHGVSFLIPLFSLIDSGSYSFYTNHTWNGELKLAAKINITASGTTRYFGMQSTDESIKNGTALVLHENATVIYCATTSSASVVGWQYEAVDGNVTEMEGSLSNFDAETGIGSLLVNATHPGYYACIVDGAVSYRTLIVPTESIVTKEELLNHSTRNFTTGSTEVVVYYENVNSSIPDASIHWTTDSAQTGDNATYTNEYNNPMNLQTVFSRVGTGVVELTSFYRESPATVIGALKLSMKDDAVITINSPTTAQEHFSDLTNALFPQPQQLNVTIFTQNITLTCSLDNCRWNIQHNFMSQDEITLNSSQYTIATLMMENDAIYSLLRVTSSGVVYSTASVRIRVTGAYVQEIQNVQAFIMDQKSIFIVWDLKETPTSISNETFSIYYGLGDQFRFAGATNNLSFILKDLLPGENYKFYIALTYAFSNIVFKTDFQQFKIHRLPVNPNRLNIPGIAALVISGCIVLLVAGVLLLFLVHSCFKKGRFSLTGTANWLQQSVRLVYHPRTTNIDTADVYVVTSSECESGNLVINDTAQQEGTHRVRSVEESYFVTQRESEGDCMYFANISQLEDTANETGLLAQESEIQSDGQLELLSIPPEREDHNVEFISPNSAKVSVNDSYKTLNDTYEIPPTTKDGSDIADVNQLEKEFDLLNAESANDDFKTTDSEVNRITLESQHFEGYNIDASYLYGGQFIATVHPIRRRNLLQLVYQDNCSLIVMLTTKDEQQDILSKASNYVRYWPVEDNVMGTDSSPEGLIDQEISLQHSKDNNTLSFRHIIFSGWRDDGSIEDIPNLRILLQIIKGHIQSNPLQPVIVHCNDGLTKTGVLLACYRAVQELEEKQCYSIQDIVKDLRRQRNNMLPSLTSYKQCYRIMEEFTLTPDQ